MYIVLCKYENISCTKELKNIYKKKENIPKNLKNITEKVCKYTYDTDKDCDPFLT
jgi:hypothetical protein